MYPEWNRLINVEFILYVSHRLLSGAGRNKEQNEIILLILGQGLLYPWLASNSLHK